MTPQALVYLAVHLAFNVLRSPNHLHFEMLRARLSCTRAHARFACQAAQYTVLHQVALLSLRKSAETQCRLFNAKVTTARRKLFYEGILDERTNPFFGKLESRMLLTLP